MRQDRADDQRVVGLKAALKRLPQRRELRSQLAFGQIGQHLRVAGPGDERVEHRAARDAEDVSRDAVELDAGALQRLCSRLASRWRSAICVLGRFALAQPGGAGA